MKYRTLLIALILLLGIVFTAGCIGEPETSKPISAGDEVTIEFTAFIGDQPMVTSSLDYYNELLSSGKMPRPILLVENPTIIAGTSTDDDYMTIPAKTNKNPYWMVIGEYNVMAAQSVGMEKGESKTFPIYGAGVNKTVVLDSEMCEMLGFSPADVQKGMVITYTRTVGETDVGVEFDLSNLENGMSMVRDMLVVDVTEESVTLQDTYDTIVMKIV